MGFLRSVPSLNGCSCERRGGRVRGMARVGRPGMGDAVSQAEATAASASQAVADAVVQDPAVKKQVMLLQAQLNRFGSSAPVGYQFVVPPLDLSGRLDVRTAALAVQILQRRYTDAAVTFPGESDAALSKLRLVTSAAAMVDPISFVLAGPPPAIAGTVAPGDGIVATTTLLQKYADSKLLKPAQSVTILDTIFASNPQVKTYAMVGAGLAAALYFMGGR